jgi:hypothetical protein
LDGIGKDLGFGFFEGQVQRRGGRVNIPEIGSRVGVFSFGGIYGIHAVLRREYNWGNLFWMIFEVLVGDPRGAGEEGGPMLRLWGEL